MHKWHKFGNILQKWPWCLKEFSLLNPKSVSGVENKGGKKL